MKDKSLFSYETLVHAIAGSAGSVIAFSAFYPLDTVRHRLQLEDGRVSKGTIQVILDVIEKEGVGKLYEGIRPMLKALCASNFVYFYTFHGIKSLHPKENATAVRDLIIGMFAGAVNVFTTTPLWVVSSQMRTINGHSPSNYKGLVDGLFKIYRTSGLAALWASVVPSLLLTTNPAIHYMTYERIKRRFSGRQLSALSYFLIGALSKTIATVLTYPLQLIQTKMRHGPGGRGHQNISGETRPVNRSPNFIQIFMHILRTQGPGGLYKGMESKIIQTVLTAALMLVVYEKIRRWIFAVLLRGRK